MADCLFCSIAAGDIPAEIVWRDDSALAFKDLNPQAPTHVLVIPRKHVANIVAAGEDDEAGTALLRGVAATARQLGLENFRTVCNTGAGLPSPERVPRARTPARWATAPVAAWLNREALGAPAG